MENITSYENIALTLLTPNQATMLLLQQRIILFRERDVYFQAQGIMFHQHKTCQWKHRK